METTKKSRRRKRNYSSGDDDEPIVDVAEIVDADEGKVAIEPTVYAVLGQDEFPSAKVIRSVAEWIRNARLFSADLRRDSAPLTSICSANDDFLSIIASAPEIERWFPVQIAVLPILLARDGVLPPRDLCISAPTGSGKTLCYVLPILHRLSTEFASHRSAIRALVVLPVQELAVQVASEFEKYNVNGLRIVLLVGSNEYDQERRQLFGDDEQKRSADIIVATPGRLTDHLLDCNNRLSLDRLRYLVVDEADRMTIDARAEWLEHVERRAYEKRTRPHSMCWSALIASNRSPLQKILVSATLSKDVERLHQWNLFQPILFRANATAECVQIDNDSSTQPMDEIDGALHLPTDLRQAYAVCASNRKPLMLYRLLHEHSGDWRRLICFSSSKRSSQRLVLLLRILCVNNPYVIEEMSTNLFGHRRAKVLKRFANGNIRVLICSDLVARGIDFADVDCVVNYDVPPNERSFVHRAGRTARAGRAGHVLTLVTDVELTKFQSFMSAAGLWNNVDNVTVDEGAIVDDVKRYQSALVELQDKLNLAPVTNRKRRKPKLKKQ